MMPRMKAVIAVWLSCTVATGCTATPPQHDLARSAPAIVPPQIDGTIQSIQTGDPSYVVLRNVHEFDANKKSVDKFEEKIKLPSGHYVAPNHWQSDRDTLDLFVGDDFVLMTNTGKMNDVSHYQPFAGIVNSINNKEMVVQKVLYGSSAKGDSQAMTKTKETVTIRLAPYTIASFNGDGASASNKQISQIAPGVAVLFVLIGPPSEYIATQITFFHSIHDAGWHLE